MSREPSGVPSIDDWSKSLINRAHTAGDSDDRSATAEFPDEQAQLLNAGDAPRIRSAQASETVDIFKGAVDGPRCVLVTSSLDAGGMDEVVVFLARRLPKHGIRTAVLHASATGSPTGTPNGRLGRVLLSYGIEVVELAAAAGSRWLKEWLPDVISAHGAPSWVLETANELSVPYVDTLHGMHSFFEKYRSQETERGRRIAGIVAVSELVRRQYLEINPKFSSDQIVTIPNGVDDVRRMPGNRDRARARWGIRDEYVFLSLARHCLQKNTYGLVAAFADVAARYPEAHLVIAGRPDDSVYFEQVKHLRERLPCRDRIHLRDYHQHPAELLAFADGFVLNSFFEGWSLASMEALYAGIPVVLSEVGGAREQVGNDGERGTVVPNPLGNPIQVDWEKIRNVRFTRQINRTAIVDAMSLLIENRAFWLAARDRLICESKVRFHPDVCLASHARFLRAVANRKPLLVENRT